MKLTRLQQSQISGSLSFNDQMMSLTGENRTLVDDLNSLRTQIRKIQGTDVWTDNLSGSQDLADIHAAMHVTDLDASFQGELDVAEKATFTKDVEVGADLILAGGNIKAADGYNITVEEGGFVWVHGALKVGGNDIQASDDTVAISLTGADVAVAGELKVGGDTIRASDTSVAISLSGADVVVEGNLTVGGNDIKASDDTVALTLSDATGDVAVAGNLKVGGNDIKASDDTVALTLSDATGDVAVAGILKVGGDEIKASDDTVAISLSSANVIVAGTLTVGGDIVYDSTGEEIMRFTSAGFHDLKTAGALIVGENVIRSSDGDPGLGTIAIHLGGAAAGNADGNDVRVAGDLIVGSNVIKSYDGFDGATAITLSGNDVEVEGELQVSGDSIKSSTGAEVMSFAGADVSMPGNLTVAGDIVVNGAMAVINTENLAVKDAIIGLGYVSGSEGPEERAAGDRGFVFSRGGNNVAAYWDETAEEFRLAFTGQGPEATAIEQAGWVNLHANNMVAEGNLTVEGNNIYGADGLNITLGASGDVSLVGTLKVGANVIKASDGATALTLSDTSGDVAVAGDLKVGGGDIKSSAGATAISLTGQDVSMPGNLTVSGDLVVNGAMTVVNTAHLAVKDTIIALGYASGSEGPVEVAAEPGDRGFVFSRYGVDNVATFWDNADSKFKMVYTTSGPEATEISENGYADFHAGIVYSQAGFSGSLTKLVDGSDYLVAGVGISVAVNQNGSITISGASNSYNKGYLAGNSAHINTSTGVVDFAAAGLGTLSSGAGLDKNVDVYLNGALLAYGPGRDVTAISQTSVTLDTVLAGSLMPDDVITVVLRSLA